MWAHNGDDRLFFEAAGEGEPSLLFVHGLGGDARVWDAQIAHFSPRRRVAALDLPGHGDSVRRPAYIKGHFYRDAQCVARAAGLRRPVVVGWSLGAGVAVDYAVNDPGGLSGVVLVDHTASPPGLPDGPAERTPQEARLMALLESDYAGAGIDALIDLWLADGQDGLVEVRRALRRPLLRTSFEHVAAIRGQPWGGAGRPVLEEVRVPALAIQGGGSRLGQGGAASAAMIRRRMPAADVHVIPGHGHAVHLTAPEPFNQALRGFVERLPAT